MKKKIIIIISVIFAIIFIYVVGSGFMKNPSVFVNDYEVSKDGKTITLEVGVASSIGYVRDIKTHEEAGILYLEPYSAFGGINGSIGARNTFVLNLNENITAIFIYRGNKDYQRLLIKTEDGNLKRVQ